jgi:hypothetical protein
VYKTIMEHPCSAMRDGPPKHPPSTPVSATIGWVGQPARDSPGSLVPVGVFKDGGLGLEGVVGIRTINRCLERISDVLAGGRIGLLFAGGQSVSRV